MQIGIRPACSGFTLVEAMVAATISAIFLSSLFAMNLGSMEAIRSAKESTAASQALQQRMESMRIANWHEVTDAAWLRDNLLNTAVPGGEQLKSLVETLTLVPYGSNNVGNTQLTRTRGTVTVVNQNAGLLAENAVKVIWTASYTGAPNDHAATRQIVAILAKGGVAK
jgi:prepilin-type N-terminal cleavage/methylation domain-containing protein